jgi:hypothetical protein
MTANRNHAGNAPRLILTVIEPSVSGKPISVHSPKHTFPPYRIRLFRRLASFGQIALAARQPNLKIRRNALSQKAWRRIGFVFPNRLRNLVGKTGSRAGSGAADRSSFVLTCGAASVTPARLPRACAEDPETQASAGWLWRIERTVLQKPESLGPRRKAEEDEVSEVRRAQTPTAPICRNVTENPFRPTKSTCACNEHVRLIIPLLAPCPPSGPEPRRPRFPTSRGLRTLSRPAPQDRRRCGPPIGSGG